MALITLKEHEFTALTVNAYNALKQGASKKEVLAILEQALKVAARHCMLDLCCISTAIEVDKLEPELKAAFMEAVEKQESPD